MKKLVCIDDFRVAAQRRLPRIAYDYLEPGAEDGLTCAWNRKAFADVAFDPRILRGVGEVDLSVALFGRASRLPLVVGPTGFANLFWPGADGALANGAADAGIPFVLSTAATTSIEDIAAGTRSQDAARWFQLYLLKEREANEALVARAEAAGYGALVLTVDTACAGKRDAGMRHGSRLPLRLDREKLVDFMRHPHWTAQVLAHGQPRLANFHTSSAKPFILETHLKRGLGWDDVAWLRPRGRKPIILKGIQSVHDAVLAAEAGIDGIVVSNHGGRQLDASPASLHLLPGIAAAVGASTTVMVDSGFRRGSDVIKALALGARAVWLGRATLYGVAAAGRPGVDKVLAIFEDEMRRAMILAGVPDLRSLDRSALRGS